MNQIGKFMRIVNKAVRCEVKIGKELLNLTSKKQHFVKFIVLMYTNLYRRYTIKI